MTTIDIPDQLHRVAEEVAATYADTDVDDLVVRWVEAGLRTERRMFADTVDRIDAVLLDRGADRIVAAMRQLPPEPEESPCPSPEPTTDPEVTTVDGPPAVSSNGLSTTITPEPSTTSPTESPASATAPPPPVTTAPTPSETQPDELSTPDPDGSKDELSCPMRGCEEVRERDPAPDRPGLADHLNAVHGMSRDGALVAVDRWTPDLVIDQVDGRYVSELDDETDWRQAPHVCECGRSCKGPQGLAAHQRACDAERDPAKQMCTADGGRCGRKALPGGALFCPRHSSLMSHVGRKLDGKGSYERAREMVQDGKVASHLKAGWRP